MLLLLLLLSRFSRVRLCAIPETAAHQAPLSLGSSRQEHWSGLPFPSPLKHNKSPQIVFTDNQINHQQCLGSSQPSKTAGLCGAMDSALDF